LTLTKSYGKAWANRQAAIKQLTQGPFVSAPLILDRPNSIFVYPSAMLVEDHIESGNSWAKLIWEDSQDVQYQDVQYKETSVRFFFAWTNPFDYLVVSMSALTLWSGVNARLQLFQVYCSVAGLRCS